jgi:hypothetical protein
MMRKEHLMAAAGQVGFLVMPYSSLDDDHANYNPSASSPPKIILKCKPGYHIQAVAQI